MKRKLSPSSSSSLSSSSSSSCINEQPLKNPKIKNKKKPSTTSAETAVRRSSKFRGVTRHRCTGRFEAHLWDKSSWNIAKKKKGKQIYLGAYDDEEAAARTYDLAALKYWGPKTTLNFPIDTYKNDMNEIEKMSKEEYIASLRRKSSGFSRGVSIYRGVARHHHNGRWEARIGQVDGNRYTYLGTFATQEEAARAYDIAAITHRKANAVTNFDISNYSDYLNSLSTQQHDDSPQAEATSNDEVNENNNDGNDEVNESNHDGEKYELQGLEIAEPQEEIAEQLADIAEPQEEIAEQQEEIAEAGNQNLNFTSSVEEEENPWSFCRDVFYDPFSFSPHSFDEYGEGMPLDLFYDDGFEANIDSIFSEQNFDNNGNCVASPSSSSMSSASTMSFFSGPLV